MNPTKIKYFNLLLIGIVTIISGCNNTKSPERIVCTTTVAADLCDQLLPPSVGIMGPGIDPHTYQSKSSDHQLLKNAEVVVYSGLHLEGKMTKSLEHLSKSQHVFAMSDALTDKDLLKSKDFGGNVDPHFWFDIDLYKKSTKYIANQLINTFPNLKDSISQNLEVYLKELDRVSVQIEKKINSLEGQQRMLVTAHDAFGYYGRRFGIEVKGIQGASTATEAGLRDIVQLTHLLKDRKIKSIFVESSVSEKNIRAIIESCSKEGHQISNGGTLYSDALGEKNGVAGNYVDMMLYNTNTIVDALK